MNATIPHTDTRALYSQDGKTWQDGSAVTWPKTPDPEVSKIVIGTPFKAGDEPQTITDLPEIPRNFATLYPNLTHLHLWQIASLTSLPELPTTLKCLDVRRCSNVCEIRNLPEALDTLVLEAVAEHFTSLPKIEGSLSQLADLSLRACIGLSTDAVSRLLQQSPSLRLLDLSATSITEIACPWPAQLVDIRLNECGKLRRLPRQWPTALRRIELRNATAMTSLPAFSPEVDYVDLAYTSSLRQLPTLPATPIESTGERRPRTLFLYETGVPLERDLKGESDTTNVAARVLADQQASEKGRKSDCELKVILLGNGRCGKSSLARCWIEGPENFRKDERTTHGVRLWEKKIQFAPVDELNPDDKADGHAVLNIWDFAGQDLYHSTHRLFLQSRAIFIICHNDHPENPGADEASDQRERIAIQREGDDVHRPLQYWLDQVESLGRIPGTDMHPPVLIVRTKADRWDEPTSGSEVLFSASTGRGLSAVKDWVEEQASRLLGTWPERSLPASAVAVKNEIRPWIQKNREHYWKTEDWNRIVQSPHPKISRDEFDEIVRRQCSGDYADNPSLLLDRFHRSGFLYHDERYLSDVVILDQRWAIQGIYTFASRQSEFDIRHQLFEWNGRFTRRQLAELSWRPAGYDEAAMNLFLQFMTSCGMCFELLRSDESASGETVYAAPGFFPSRTRAAELFSEIDVRSENGLRYVIEQVSQADLIGIIARIGSDWSRSMYAWRWGCRFASASTGAFCCLDWARPDDSDTYFHDLIVTFTGPDDEPFRSLVNQMISQVKPGPIFVRHGNHEKPWTEIDAWKGARLANTDLLEGQDFADRFQRSPKPTRDKANGVRVTFSFAGSDERHGRIGDIPSTVANKLRKELLQHNLGTVLSYDLTEDEERLRAFTEDLAKGDLILLFWSRKYWDSEYCVPEMMLIHQEPPKGRLLSKRVLTYVLDNARLSRNGEITADGWEQRWVKRAEEREQRAEVKSSGDLRRKKKFLKRDRILHEWYEFVLDEAEFDEFIQTMLDYRLCRRISTPTNDDEVESTANNIVEFVKGLLGSPNDLFDRAVQRFNSGERQDALLLLQQAILRGPAANLDLLTFLTGPTSKGIPAEFKEYALAVLNGRSDD